MLKLWYLIAATVCQAGFVHAQQAFLVGTGSASLEPDSTVFSVALAGYGVPREGRFSITWEAVAEASNITAITAYNNALCAVNTDGDLLQANRDLTWTKKATCKGAIALAALRGKLLAIKDGSIWGYTERVWKKLGTAPSIITLAVLNNRLYATTTQNELLVANQAMQWKKIDKAPSIISLAAYNNRLYALNSGDSLWYWQNRSWMQIGRNNGATFTIDAKHIVILNNRLYAVAADGQLYRARHNTKNNLTARALAIKSQQKTIVIAGLDLTGFNASFIDDIKKKITAQRGIPASAILINASHTHYAPVTQAWTTWGDFYHTPDSHYLTNIARKAVINAINAALDHMKPATISIGRSSTAIGLNRRGNANRFKPYDSTLDVLRITDANKQLQCILFSTACHPVFKNTGDESFTLNANFPAIARQVIETQSNAPHTLFIQGCGGDINPKSDDHTQTGNELAADVLKLLDQPMDTIRGGISFALDQILIPVTPWTADSIGRFAATNAAKPGDLVAEKNVRWANLMLDRYKKNEVATTLPLYVQTLNIGNWKMVGLSREVVNEYAPAIRNLWPAKKVTVAGYCNDVSSYLPIQWHIQEKHYEGFESFFWYGQPGIPPPNVLDLIISSIKTNNR